MASGRRPACRPSASTSSAPRTTSGPWGTRGPAGRARRIHYFQGNDIACAEEKAGRACQGVACDCDRWLEIWNLVFMQFERSADGDAGRPCPSRPSTPAPASSASPRWCRASARTTRPTSSCAAPGRREERRKTYGHTAAPDDVSMRVIADHPRATTFLIADGVLPSNEGRGYVLRKIMRRAIRHGQRLGLDQVFLPRVGRRGHLRDGGRLPRDPGEPLPSSSRWPSRRRSPSAARSTRDSRILEEQIRHLTARGEKTIPGKVAFQLYDTFGFPMDLTRVIAEEHTVGVDEAGFESAMAEQRARSEWKGSGEEAVEGDPPPDIQRRVPRGEVPRLRRLGREGHGPSRWW